MALPDGGDKCRFGIEPGPIGDHRGALFWWQMSCRESSSSLSSSWRHRGMRVVMNIMRYASHDVPSRLAEAEDTSLL